MCGMCSVSKSQSQSNDVCSFNLVFLTPHPSPLTPHPSPLTPHPSPYDCQEDEARDIGGGTFEVPNATAGGMAQFLHIVAHVELVHYVIIW